MIPINQNKTIELNFSTPWFVRRIRKEDPNGAGGYACVMITCNVLSGEEKDGQMWNIFRENKIERVVVKMRFYVDDQELISLSSDTHP